MKTYNEIIKATAPKLHKGQLEVLKGLTDNRFVICVAGRRWGKTTLSLVAALDSLFKGERVQIVFPVYPQAMDSWLNLKSLIRQIPEEFYEIRESEKRIVLNNGAFLQIKSADKPERLRGAGGISLVIFDEVAYQNKETWDTIRPILSDSLGKALFISTPNGINWFHELYEKAKIRKDWKTYHFITADNPTIHKGEIEQAKEELGSLVYAQEFLAEFTDVGAVFKSEWFNYFTEEKEEDEIVYKVGDEIVPHSELSIFGCMDTALSLKETADYSAIITVGISDSGILLVLDLLRARLEAPDIIPAMERFIDKWNMAWLGVEDSSFGLGVVQMARRKGLPIRSLKADKSKVARAIPAAAGLEAGKIYFRNGATWLNEFERELTSFPTGSHDDQVDVLAYAARFGIVRKTNWSVT
jgi:predicted phage terminase large subunit-like protein|tara:strand:- start:901 stop:2139 length:1239 start_codon:yes stop_codon:yes gene_type:complete